MRPYAAQSICGPTSTVASRLCCCSSPFLGPQVRQRATEAMCAAAGVSSCLRNCNGPAHLQSRWFLAQRLSSNPATRTLPRRSSNWRVHSATGGSELSSCFTQNGANCARVSGRSACAGQTWSKRNHPLARPRSSLWSCVPTTSKAGRPRCCSTTCPQCHVLCCSISKVCNARMRMRPQHYPPQLCRSPALLAIKRACAAQ